jgi:hypothetical protein
MVAGSEGGDHGKQVRQPLSVLAGDDLAEAVNGAVREPLVDAGQQSQPVVVRVDLAGSSVRPR